MSNSSQPGGSPTPAISPRSLIFSSPSSAPVVLKSMSMPLSHRNARVLPPSQENDCPTTCSLELIPNAMLKQSPGKVPRSVICPFLQSVAWDDSSSGVFAAPTASPRLLSQYAIEELPPSVPKSVRVPWSQKKACWTQESGQPASPARFDWPIT